MKLGGLPVIVGGKTGGVLLIFGVVVGLKTGGAVEVLDGGTGVELFPPPPPPPDVGRHVVRTLKLTVAQLVVLEQLKLSHPIFSPHA